MGVGGCGWVWVGCARDETKAKSLAKEYHSNRPSVRLIAISCQSHVSVSETRTGIL